MFKRILIANRGEIAVRIIRGCRELGVSPAVIYSEIDKSTLAVQLADVAVEVFPSGGPTPRGPYLNIEGVVQAALAVGADAIHPGYGFISENADFGRACQAAGITFIGPSPEAIEALGNKNHARTLMAGSGIPIVPGSEVLPELEQAYVAAEKIGYPVLIKASGGGGGRGMRKVASAAELKTAFPQARSESLAAFGSADIYLEKYIEQPRHIEIQILGDRHGNVVHLGERECSIQRRFQKMIEESPSPFVTPELRARMGRAAIAGAKDIGYVGAGTFEFLVDSQRNFYFLEVNTRLQVEHPVTEQVTGIDLVKAMIRVASGEPLPFDQEEIHQRGHSLECRITCENPYQGFLPTPGRIQRLRFPQGPGVRIDTHLYEGYTVPTAFDSMVAKLITTGSDREEARRRMLDALREFELGGVTSTIPFHIAVLEHPEFVAGNLSTHFLADHLPGLKPETTSEEKALAALATALERLHQANASPTPSVRVGSGSEESMIWKQAGRNRAVVR